MKSSFELLWDWGIKKMNLDEQIFKRLDKQILNQPMHENVIPVYLDLKIIKPPLLNTSGVFFVLNQRCIIRCMLDVPDLNLLRVYFVFNLSICTIIPYPDKKIAKIANRIKDAIS
jgi:hypothetical protein